jgi:hypothetical protein
MLDASHVTWRLHRGAKEVICMTAHMREPNERATKLGAAKG